MAENYLNLFEKITTSPFKSGIPLTASNLNTIFNELTYRTNNLSNYLLVANGDVSTQWSASKYYLANDIVWVSLLNNKTLIEEIKVCYESGVRGVPEENRVYKTFIDSIDLRFGVAFVNSIDHSSGETSNPLNKLKYLLENNISEVGNKDPEYYWIFLEDFQPKSLSPEFFNKFIKSTSVTKAPVYQALEYTPDLTKNADIFHDDNFSQLSPLRLGYNYNTLVFGNGILLEDNIFYKFDNVLSKIKSDLGVFDTTQASTYRPGTYYKFDVSNAFMVQGNLPSVTALSNTLVLRDNVGAIKTNDLYVTPSDTNIKEELENTTYIPVVDNLDGGSKEVKYSSLDVLKAKIHTNNSLKHTHVPILDSIILPYGIVYTDEPTAAVSDVVLEETIQDAQSIYYYKLRYRITGNNQTSCLNINVYPYNLRDGESCEIRSIIRKYNKTNLEIEISGEWGNNVELRMVIIDPVNNSSIDLDK